MFGLNIENVEKKVDVGEGDVNRRCTVGRRAGSPPTEATAEVRRSKVKATEGEGDRRLPKVTKY